VGAQEFKPLAKSLQFAQLGQQNVIDGLLAANWSTKEDGRLWVNVDNIWCHFTELSHHACVTADYFSFRCVQLQTQMIWSFCYHRFEIFQKRGHIASQRSVVEIPQIELRVHKCCQLPRCSTVQQWAEWVSLLYALLGYSRRNTG